MDIHFVIFFINLMCALLAMWITKIQAPNARTLGCFLGLILGPFGVLTAALLKPSRDISANKPYAPARSVASMSPEEIKEQLETIFR